jgi:phosphate transport system substrate-binding protein
MKLKRRTFAAFTALATVAASLAVVASPVQAAERIKVDGSSTVAPITSAVAQVFRSYRRAAQKDNAPVTVGISGTGGGFSKFCTNDANVQTDISNASRPIKESEAQACAAAGVEFVEIRVAIDALTVAVNPGNDAVSDITFEEIPSVSFPITRPSGAGREQFQRSTLFGVCSRV